MTGKALVTGLGGFTGHYMARELEAMGYQVVGLGQGLAEAEGHYAVDLRDTQRLQSAVAEIQPQLVVHLAAIAFVSHGDISDIYTSNIVGTRNLLAALAACDTPPIGCCWPAVPMSMAMPA